jgi:hypothetical protein
LDAFLKKHFFIALAYESYYFESSKAQCHQLELESDDLSDPKNIEIFSTPGFRFNDFTKREYYVDTEVTERPDDESPWEALNELSDPEPLYKLLATLEVSGFGSDACDRKPGVRNCGDLNIDLDEELMSLGENPEKIERLIEKLEEIEFFSEIEEVIQEAVIFTYGKLIDEL